MGIINLKGPDSRNSGKKHARTLLRSEFKDKPNFLIKILLY